MEYPSLSYSSRFFLLALVRCLEQDMRTGDSQAYNACALLADKQFDVFLAETFKSAEGVTQKIDELVDWVYRGKKEPSWHQQAREMIESR